MIIADKIIALRKKNGWSQEELAEMLDVSRQSISKWEGAQSIPDMNRILRMAEVFGVSTDYLLKDELETPDIVETSDLGASPALRTVSMEEASAFLEERNRYADKVSLGVLLCILSPVLLIILAAAQEAEMIALSENAAGGIGLIFLFALVGGAVALFVSGGSRHERYEYLEKDPIETAYGVSGLATERREKYKDVHTRYLTLGIVMCIISVLPLFVSMILFGEEDFPMTIAAGILLVIVAIGVFFIVRVSVIWDGFLMLLEEGEYSRSEKEAKKKTNAVGIIYWLAVLTVFLAYSFYTNHWREGAFIWPVAAVGYGIVHVIVKTLHNRG